MVPDLRRVSECRAHLVRGRVPPGTARYCSRSPAPPGTTNVPPLRVFIGPGDGQGHSCSRHRACACVGAVGDGVGTDVGRAGVQGCVSGCTVTPLAPSLLRPGSHHHECLLCLVPLSGKEVSVTGGTGRDCVRHGITRCPGDKARPPTPGPSLVCGSTEGAHPHLFCD